MREVRATAASHPHQGVKASSTTAASSSSTVAATTSALTAAPSGREDDVFGCNMSAPKELPLGQALDISPKLSRPASPLCLHQGRGARLPELESAIVNVDSGSTSTSDPVAPSAKEAAKKSQQSQPAALATEPDVEITGDAKRGGTAQPPAAHQLSGEIPAHIQDSTREQLSACLSWDQHSPHAVGTLAVDC